MSEANETMEGNKPEPAPTYSKGDIVWVKLSSYWWPGEVINGEDLPGDLLSGFKRPPLVIVQFFDEDSYEYVRNWSNINPYNCPKKTDFIKKGMAGFHSKLSHMAKFPKDIGTAEERTNGNPNILGQAEFLPLKKINYDEIFGTPSPKKSTKGKVSLPSAKKPAARDSNQPHITHRRFIGNDDYRAYICVQFPGKDRKWDSDDEEIKKLNEESEKVLSCRSCSFKTKRLEVMIFHTKMHIQGVYVTSKRKAKKSKGAEPGSESETDAAVTKSPKPKQRKKKEVKPKTTDAFSNLLEEWDETDEEMEEEITSPKPPKAKKKAVQVKIPPIDNKEEETQKGNSDKVQENKSTTTTASATSKKAESTKLEPIKNTQDDIKNCFDFDEEEEDDEFLMPTSTGRKIPRVIPEKPKPSISELLEQSQKEEDLEKEKASDSVGDTENQQEATATENGTDGNTKEILKLSQSINREQDIDENIENTFKELMAETELPTLDELAQNLKPEQNFHDARTVKFPDKGGTALKGGATSKGGTSKKRFVTSFEDFEAGFRKLEDEKQRTKKRGDKEVKAMPMLKAPRIDDDQEQTPLKAADEIIENEDSDQALAELTSEAVETTTEVPEKHPSKVSLRTRHSAKLKETALNESVEVQSEAIPVPSVEETTAKQPDTVHSVGRRKTRQSEKEKLVGTVLDPQTDASDEATPDSRRKSSRRRTKQFVIEEDSEEIIEITREGDSDVIDSSEEVIQLDENTRKELAAIDVEIKNLKRSLDITESTTDEEMSHQISDQTEQVSESSTNESVDVESSNAGKNSDNDNRNLLKEMMELTENIESMNNIEVVREDEVPKKSYRRTRHSLITAYPQKIEDKIPSKGRRRSRQRTYEPQSDLVDDLSSKSALEISLADTRHIVEKSESLTTEPELTRKETKERRGRSRGHQKDVADDLKGKEVPKCSELNIDKMKSKIMSSLEKPIVSSELVEPPSNEKVHKFETVASEPEPTPTKGRRGRLWHQKDGGCESREKEVPTSNKLNVDSIKSKPIETLEGPTVSSNLVAPPSKEEVLVRTSAEVNTNQSMEIQQEPKSSTVDITEQTLNKPEDISEDVHTSPDPAHLSKRCKTRRDTKEAPHDATPSGKNQEPKSSTVDTTERETLNKPEDISEAGHTSPDPAHLSKRCKTRRDTKEAPHDATPSGKNQEPKSSTVDTTERETLNKPEDVSEAGHTSPDPAHLSKRCKTRRDTKEAPHDHTPSGKNQEPKSSTVDTTERETLNKPEDISEAGHTSPDPAHLSKRCKTRRDTKEAPHDATPSGKNAPTDVALEEPIVASSELDTQKSELRLTESQCTGSEFDNSSSVPEILQPPTPCTKQDKTGKNINKTLHDKEAISSEEQAPTYIPLEETILSTSDIDSQKSEIRSAESQTAVPEFASTSSLPEILEPAHKKLEETIVALSDINTQKSELHPTESESTVPKVANASSLPDILPIPKTRRGRSQKYTKEDEVLATNIESTDNVPKIEVPEPKQELTGTDIVQQPTGSVVEVLDGKPTAKTRRGRNRKPSKENEENAKSAEEFSTAETDITPESISKVPELIYKTRRSRSRKDTKEREQDKSDSQEEGHKDMITVTEQPSAVSEQAKIVADAEETGDSTKENETVEPEAIDVSLTEAVDEGIKLFAESSNTEAVISKPDMDKPVPTTRKSRRRRHTEEEPVSSDVGEDIPKNEESVPLEVSRGAPLEDAPLEVNEENIVDVSSSASENPGQVDKTEKIKFLVSDTVPDVSDESNFKVRRGRSRKHIKEHENMDTEIHETGSEPVLESLEQPINRPEVLETPISDSADKIIEHPTPKSRRSRTRKHLKGEDSASPKPAIENNESSRTVEVPSFSMLEEPFSKTRRGRSRKLTQEEEDFARAIQESLKDMAQERNQVESTAVEMRPATNNLVESDKTNADAIADALQKSNEPSRKSKKGKSRKNSKSQEHVATIPNDIISKDPVLQDQAVLPTDSNELQTDQINPAVPEVAHTVEMNITSNKPVLDQSSQQISEHLTPSARRGRTRKHAKEEQEHVTSSFESPKTIKEAPKEIDESGLLISDTAQCNSLTPSIANALELPEQPTPKLKRGRPRKHTVQEDILVATPIEVPSKIVNEIQSKELTAALEFTKTVLELVENQQTALNLDAVVVTEIQKDVEQKDILIETQFEEPTTKIRRGRSRRHTEEVLAEDLSKTIPSECTSSDVTMLDAVGNSSVVNEDGMLGQEATGDLTIPEVVEQSSANTVAEPIFSESKISDESPPKSKKVRPRKHVDENTESIIKETMSRSLQPELERASQFESPPVELDAYIKDEPSSVIKPSGRDMGSMGSIIQTAVDQSFSTLNTIPKSGLSEWVGELLKNSSKDEGRSTANRKEETPMIASSDQGHEVPESTQLEFSADKLTIQENTPLKSDIALELFIHETTLQSNEDGAIESNMVISETSDELISKKTRRRSKESLKKETTDILENIQTSAEDVKPEARCKLDLEGDQVAEGQLKTALDTTVPDQTTDLISVPVEIDTSVCNKNEDKVDTLCTKVPEELNTTLVKKNDTSSTKGRRGRPRKSVSSETLSVEEATTGQTHAILQSKSKIVEEQYTASQEIKDENKPEVEYVSERFKLDELTTSDTTKHIDHEVNSSVLYESVQTSTVAEKETTPKETPKPKTISQLPTAVPEVAIPTMLEYVHRKGPKTIILNRNRIEKGMQNKAAVSASVEQVEPSVCNKGYIVPSTSQKSWFKKKIKEKSELTDTESSQEAFKEVLKQKFKDIVSSEAEKSSEMTRPVQGREFKEDDTEEIVEQVVSQETPHSLDDHIPQSKQCKTRRNSKQESTLLVAPDINSVADQRTGLSEEKNRHVPPKKNRWSRRESYGKNDTDADNLLKETIIEAAPESIFSEEVVVEEQIVEINNDPVIETQTIVNDSEREEEEKILPRNDDLDENNQSEKVPRILDNSFADFNESEIILPPKKSKRAGEVKYNFLNDSFASTTLSLERKADSDILSFPSCDDSIMSTSLRNNIEGLIKDIDNFDNTNVSDNLNLMVKDDEEKVALDVPKAETTKGDINATDFGEIIKEPANISKCMPPKKKKIEYSKQDVTSSSGNSPLSNDSFKSEEKLANVVPQPPKKKIQKLFENSQALEKVGKVSDIPQMSPLAKKKSFLFHPEEFAQKVAEITQQIDIASMKESERNIGNVDRTSLKSEEGPLSSLDNEEVEADVNKSSTVPKKRQKRKSSSHGDHLQNKERRTSSEASDTNAGQENNSENEPIISQSQDPKDVLDSARTSDADISVPGSVLDDSLKIEKEGKIEADDIAISTADELSALATATSSGIENQVKDEPTASIKEDDVESAGNQEAPVIPTGIEVTSESEFVPISINPTVMSEKDLADAQVEITTDKVINEKKPTNLGMFSMDFLESSLPARVHTIKIKKTQLVGSPKPNNTSGTEFTSKAMTKEFDNRPLITLPKAYALKSELLDILEGNSNSSTNSSGSDQKFKTSFDNYDKQTVVQGMFDFEEAIPSQIVLSNKVDPETVLLDSPKLLERLSMSNDATKAKPMIQSDIKVSDSVSKGLITKMMKPMGTPKPGQKILIKTARAQPLSMSKITGNKPIILSEQIIRPANAPKPVIQLQGIKRQYEDIEDVETAFIIPKIAKKTVEEEVIPEIIPEKPMRGRGSKAIGKAKILQQTIITPKGEIVQSQTPTTTQSALVQAAPSENDDMVFDINSMPIVLSDDLLTPESIQNMPVVLSEDVIPQGKPITVKAEDKLMTAFAKKTVPNVAVKQQIVFKTTLSGSTTPLQAKQTMKPRILSNTPVPTNKIKQPTALLATGTSADGKPTKYVFVPSTVSTSVPQVKSAKPLVAKKQLPLPPKLPNVQTSEPQSPIVGNKIMIVTNQHGQQTRVVLTPQQQKAFMHTPPGSKTKTIIKGAIPKALLESASAGPSGIVQKTVLPSLPQGVPQGVVSPVSSHGGLLMTVGKGSKVPVHQKKVTHRTPPVKTQKTILIKNQMGQTVRKIQGTDDADLDRQVLEQLEAIKASARLQQANKSPEIINYTNRHITSSTSATKTAVRRSYPKKFDPVKVKPSVPTPQSQSQKSQEHQIPALAPLSPQPTVPQVQSQTSPNLQKQAPGKLDLPPSSPVNSGQQLDSGLQQQPVAPIIKSDCKPAPPVGAENKPTDRPLTQLVIQDGLGNQTTITEGQILAIPSETVDGQPQSYMLVTLDEMGNITPLNNEALMSLDPSLGLGGDLNNMVLQVDQGQGTVAALKPAETNVPVASTEQNKISERLQHPLPTPEPKPVPVEQPKIQEVSQAVEQQIVIGEGVLPGADAGGQQLIVTGDPIATQKFLESLSDGSTDLANILANAEGGSVLIQADGQQILIKTNTGGQPLLGISENTEAGGNPIFGTHKPNQDILAAALANTDVFPSSDQPAVHSSPVKGMQSSQLSPGGGSGVLYPMHVGNVLETSLTLNSPIMTPLEVPSLPNKKIDDDVDILNQVSKNVDLPITITDPNITQTVAHQQAISLMELALPISETTGSGDINSPSFSYSLPALDESVGHGQKPFNGSMPLLTEDVTEVESSDSSQIGKIRVAKGLQSSESTFGSNYGSLPLLPETVEEVVKTSCFGEMESLPMLTKDAIEDSGSSRDSSKPARSSPIERDIVDEGLSTLGGEMCSSLSEPPPDMFDLASITAKEEEISSDMSSIPEPEGETLSLHSENSGEIPIQPSIVANFNDLKRPGDDDTQGQDEKRQKFD